MYQVKQLADLAGVTIRTLHYYDEIGLLKPSTVGDNGYRYYADDDLLRLQQVLFYRELGIGLLQIRDILNAPSFDIVTALETHRQQLHTQIERLQTLLRTLDHTLHHLTGAIPMTHKKQMFDGFTPAQEQAYTEEAIRRWGEDSVRASVKLWNSYSAEQKAAIMTEGQTIYTDMVAAMPSGHTSPAVQVIVARWHQHLRHFYEPSIERLGGLATLYLDDPDFNANFSALHPALPQFLHDAITAYVERLEDEWLKRNADTDGE